jgi:hypothetical protein
MTERARHLAQKVFPERVRVRQWVLSLPFDLRVRAAFDHGLALALARITARAIESRYRRLARRAGLRAPRGGSVCVRVRRHWNAPHEPGRAPRRKAASCGLPATT